MKERVETFIKEVEQSEFVPYDGESLELLEQYSMELVGNLTVGHEITELTDDMASVLMMIPLSTYSLSLGLPSEDRSLLDKTSRYQAVTAAHIMKNWERLAEGARQKVDEGILLTGAEIEEKVKQVEMDKAIGVLNGVLEDYREKDEERQDFEDRMDADPEALQ